MEKKNKEKFGRIMKKIYICGTKMQFATEIFNKTMYFERKSYLQQLISAEGNGMIKIITGIRRCGKSFLLFDIFKKHLQRKGVQEDHWQPMYGIITIILVTNNS